MVMELKGKAKLLRIFSGDSDRVYGKCLYEAIVEEARKAGMAGATVYRGIESFGASHSIHTLKIFALSGDLPVVIDIIDSEENIEKFIPLVNELMDLSGKGGLIITEEVNVVRYKTGEKYKNKKWK
jgi:PII-like signaling protein